MELKEWDPDAALKSLESGDQHIALEFNYYDRVQKMCQDASPGAMQSIVHLALYSQNEKVRFSCAQYVIERACGRVQDQPPPQTREDPFRELLETVLGESTNE